MKEQILTNGTRLIPIFASGAVPYHLIEVSKRFQDTWVLNRDTADFPRTGLMLLTGASGAGKTTLFNIIAGLLLPDSGKIEGIANAKTAYLFQEDRLLPWYTVRQNLLLAAGAEAAEKWLRITGLLDAAHKYPNELSGGMKRRAALARAMAYGGEIYLLDEPFNGVDTALKNAILPEILHAASESLLILATHEEDVISQLTKMVR